LLLDGKQGLSEEKCTPLHHDQARLYAACRDGFVDIVKLEISYGADANKARVSTDSLQLAKGGAKGKVGNISYRGANIEDP
jgi:hypothetical protein